MEIITRTAKLQALVEKLDEDNSIIGFVPTMGSLHEGHLSLVREARRMSDAVIVSVFVNPKQFGPGEDFEKYPRDITRDVDVLTPAGVNYVFAPTVEELFPKGFSTWVDVAELSDRLEGQSRPGHFRGVATVLTVLFNMLRPKFVFMGQKDAQQTVIAKRLVKDLHLPVEIVIMPTIRESDGIAMSSRNSYLSPSERRAATVLSRSLFRAQDLFNHGEKNASKLLKAMRKEIASEPLARVDYIAVTDTERLEPIEDLDGQRALISVACYFGPTRLIDNLILNDEKFKSMTGRLKLGI